MDNLDQMDIMDKVWYVHTVHLVQSVHTDHQVQAHRIFFVAYRHTPLNTYPLSYWFIKEIRLAIPDRLASSEVKPYLLPQMGLHCRHLSAATSRRCRAATDGISFAQPAVPVQNYRICAR